MRQVLFEVSLQQPWLGWTTRAGQVELIGAGWVLLLLAAIYTIAQAWTGKIQELKRPANWIPLGVALVAVTFVGPRIPVSSFPIFGYGMMVLLGFLCAIGFARYRCRQIGYDPEVIMDLAFWILVAGIAGGRAAFILQYPMEILEHASTVPEKLFALVNLSKGGLVLIGGMFGSAVGFFTFCHLKKVAPLPLLDIITPSIFIGIGFGRIGCLLNGCCFGDRCDLPWAIYFPQGSTTFNILAMRGFVDAGAQYTIPLHPTQIYSSINGFVLATVTAYFFWRRQHPGDVFALGCILYPITRIMLEFIRADEMGQFGTSFTISQWYSVGILIAGIGLLLRNRLAPTSLKSSAVAVTG